MSEYKLFRRKPGYGPGHELIWVLMSGQHFVQADPPKPGIQCATTDRIPFVMKPRDLAERYELAPKTQ